ncbi:GH3 domain-containing protein [Denticeps clupeoides]|nr:GH3 domain-containing protein [Denticeps clupeoides]
MAAELRRNALRLSCVAALLAVTVAAVKSSVEGASLVCVLSLGAMIYLGTGLRWTLKGQSRSLGDLVALRVARKAVAWVGRRQRVRLEADTRDVRRAQEETLLKRLRRGADTWYGKQHQFSSIQDCETFRQRHPVTGYDHYSELVERVAAGEERVLTADKPLVLAMTSGTSGTSNMLLSTKDTSTEFFMQGVAVCLDVMQRAFPATAGAQRTAKFFYMPAFRQSAAGVPIGPNSSSPAASRHLLRLYTTPAPAFRVPGERDALYLHLLFALKDASVGTLESNFASTIFYAFRTLQERWVELVDDVESGRIAAGLDLQPEVRSALEKLTGPDPGRGAELRAQFLRGFEGIALRLWPHLNLVLTVDSGSNQIYGERLRRHCCKGVPFYSPFYAATEGLIGVNLWPLDDRRRYLLCPRSMFCEFLPEGSLEAEQPNTVLMHQAQQGHSYELVLTNAAGLYRYRIGDVVKVVGFHNQCPLVEFQYRRGQMLNVRGEKVSEAAFLAALKRTVDQWPAARLVDYGCAESGILGEESGGAQPHYHVFLELSGVRNLTEEQRDKLDHSLQEDSAVYRSFRFKGSIGPMRVQLVKEGTFQELKGLMTASSGTSPNTFKMHRVIRRKDCASFLLGKTIS